MKEIATRAAGRATGHLPEEIARQIENAFSTASFPSAPNCRASGSFPWNMVSAARWCARRFPSSSWTAFVEARAGSGVFVIDESNQKAFRIQPLVVEEAQSLEQLMELLVAIEVAATRIAAVNRTPEDLKQIKRALIGLEYAIISDKLGDEEDYAFHDAIVIATHNPHFIALCKHLEYGARHVIRQARTNTRSNLKDMLDAVQDEHKAIYEAIELGDPEQAGIAAERHLRNATQRMKVYLSADNRTN